MIFLKKKKKFYGTSLIEEIAKFAADLPTPRGKVFWDLDKNGMTQSQLLEFLSCRRRAELSYKEGYTTKGTSHPITFGNLFHACLESIYKSLREGVRMDGIILKNVIDNTISEYKKEVLEERPLTEDDAAELALDEGYLNVLLPAYVSKYAKKDQKQEWLLVEDEFMNEINGVIFRGKFDRVCRNVHGEVWIQETKTKYMIDPAIQDRLSFDPQVMIYILNYKLQTGEMPKGFVYDIIQRPRLRRKVDESLKEFVARVARDVDDSYFQRIRMRVTEEEHALWMKNDFQPMVGEFIDWARGKTPTFRNPAACETKYGLCKFIRVCGLGDYTGLIPKKKVFSELENQVNTAVPV